MNRRDFLIQASSAAATISSLEATALPRVRWQVGCFNRPWTKWSFDETLTQIRSAGYKSTGLLSRTKEEPFIAAEATPDYLSSLKARIAASRLSVNMGALRSRHNIPFDESMIELKKQIDNAHFLSIKTVMSFGADNPAEFENYYRAMRETAAYGQEKGVHLVMKPHGGISGSADDILNVIQQVNHPNFSIWYDAGNIIHYTGGDPVAGIEKLAPHITGFCAKDCGELKGDVMIQFGSGKVDFAAVFKKLKAGGFKGPVMVECCKVGDTPEITTENTRANRVFLEKVLAQI